MNCLGLLLALTTIALALAADDLFLRRTGHAFVIESMSDPRRVEDQTKGAYFKIPPSVQLFDKIQFEVQRPVAQIRVTGDLVKQVERGGMISLPEEGRLIFSIAGFYLVYHPRRLVSYLDNVPLRSRDNGLDVIFVCAGQTLNVEGWSLRPRGNRSMGGVFLRSLNHSTSPSSLCAKKVLGFQKTTVVKAVIYCSFRYRSAMADDPYWWNRGYPSYGMDTGIVLRTLLNFFKLETFRNASFASASRRGLDRAKVWCTRDFLRLPSSYECLDEDWILETVCQVLAEHTTNYFRQVSMFHASDWRRAFDRHLYAEVSEDRQKSDLWKDDERLLAWLIYFQYKIFYSQAKIYGGYAG